MKHLRLYSYLSAFLLLLAILSAPGLFAGSASAQAPGWSRLGALPDGSWLLEPDGAEASTIFALSGAGISRTTDGGRSWTVCNADARSMRVVTPLEGQTANTLLYASTPGGLRASEDGCRTWRDVPTQDVLPSGAHVRWVAPYPNNQSILYAGMDGLGGMYRSTDNGGSWQAASRGLPPRAWVTSLTADPRRPEVVTVGVRYSDVEHPPAYIFRSTDGGITWRSSSLGIYVTPNNGSFITGLGWSGSNLLAATTRDGLYQSTDQGVTWQPATMPRRNGDTGSEPAGKLDRVRAGTMPLQINSMYTTGNGAVLLSTPEGVYQSLDGTQTWQSFGPGELEGKPVLLAVDQNSGRSVVASSLGMWGYRIPSSAVSVPSATPQISAQLPPTPPPPPALPTTTPVPPTPVPTSTPVPPTPTPVLVEGPKPSDPVQAADPEIGDFFPETGHNVKYGFRDFWRSNGGIAQFGFPLTEEFVENGVSVQYFERARLEYRDGEVSVGRLGAELIEGRFFRPIPYFPSVDDNVYFGVTGHSISGPFLDFWRAHGREPLLGLPLSQSYQDDGSEFQWFERARFEWHSSRPEDDRIVLGNIGTEMLRKRGWIR
jgi:photosystem II stability/assembly factor-like uncharacterized protein